MNRLKTITAIAASTVLIGITASVFVLGQTDGRPTVAVPNLPASHEPHVSYVPASPAQHATLAAPGTIVGSAAYPAGNTPADLEVCAEAVKGPQVTCSKVQRGDHHWYGIGYRLTVPAGSYRVYSVSKANNPEFRGYYTAGARCERQLAARPGYDPSRCGDRSILQVRVGSGQTVSGIDPVDYYGPFND